MENNLNNLPEIVNFPKIVNLTIKILKYDFSSEPLTVFGTNYNPFKKEWINLKKRKCSF